MLYAIYPALAHDYLTAASMNTHRSADGLQPPKFVATACLTGCQFLLQGDLTSTSFVTPSHANPKHAVLPNTTQARSQPWLSRVYCTLLLVMYGNTTAK